MNLLQRLMYTELQCTRLLEQELEQLITTKVPLKLAIPQTNDRCQSTVDKIRSCSRIKGCDGGCTVSFHFIPRIQIESQQEYRQNPIPRLLRSDRANSMSRLPSHFASRFKVTCDYPSCQSPIVSL